MQEILVGFVFFRIDAGRVRQWRIRQ
jgi:hypothetical protein